MLISLWRTLFLFCLVTVVLRFMGKRQIGQLQPSELATTIIISNIAAIPIENIGSPLINSVLAIIMLASLEIVFSWLLLKYPTFRRFSVGTPRCIIKDGTIDQRELESLRWSIDDLTEQLRCNGVFNVDEVLFAFVETNGCLSVYLKYKDRPVTNEGLNITSNSTPAPPVLIIKDGILDPRSLSYCNLDNRWLKKLLKSHNTTEKEVFILSCDRDASYNLIKKESGKK